MKSHVVCLLLWKHTLEVTCEYYSDIIKKMLNKEDSEKVIENAQKWFEKINIHPAELASDRIWNAVEKIIKR